MSATFVQLGVFGLFFASAAFAIAFHQRRGARLAFAAVFLALLLWAGGLGRIAWPFFSWHLYANHGKTHLGFSEIRLADGEGREIKLDARAAPPSMATPMNRLGARLAALDPERGIPVAEFLLGKAAAYRETVEREGWARRPL